MRKRVLGLAIGLMLTAASPASAQTPLERGTYLMRGIVACGNCHTPAGPNGPLPGMELAGGLEFVEPVFTARAPNITPDLETGIGRWTDDQIIAAIREGRRPDGSIIGPPMPIALYRGISDEDARAIVAYLRATKPVTNKVARSEYRIPLPPSYGPPVGTVAAPPAGDLLARGAYLAGPLGHCVECHSTPGAGGVPDLRDKLGAGGMEFKGPWGVSIATNITPTGIGHYSDAELERIIRTGMRPNGQRLLPPMGVAYYATLSDADMRALIGYLRALPPR